MPTGQTNIEYQIAPDGTVSYDFNGHVHAVGLDLVATRQGSPVSDREIIWTKESDGSMVAQIWALEGDAPSLIAREIAINAGEDLIGGGTVHAGTNPGHTGGQVWVDAYKSGGPFATRVLLNPDGTSDFMRSARPAAVTLALISPPWNAIAGWTAPHYRLMDNGLVILGGLFQSNGAYGLPINVAFGLPVPKDPAGNAAAILMGAFNSNAGLTLVQIANNGVMSIIAPGGAPTGAGWWTSLHGLSYQS